MSDPSTASPAHLAPTRGAIAALYLVVLIDLVGFGMIIPVFPFFATRIGVDPAAVIFLLGLYSVGQLIGAPLWGMLSDRIGRRPVLLVTLLANAAATMLLAIADTEVLLGISRLVSGIAAGNISTAFAYVTDIADAKSRPRYLGLLGSAFGVGFVIGPALGGLIAGAGDDPAGFARVAHTAGALSLLAFALTAALVKESLSPEHRQRGGGGGSFAAVVRIPAMRVPLLASFVVIAASAVLLSTFALWADATFHIGPRQLGAYYAYIGLLSAIIQGGAIGPLTRRIGERQLAFAGASLIAIALLVLPLVSSHALTLLALTLLGTGSACFLPSASGLVAHAAPPRERGAALGAYQGAASLGRTVGPFVASGVTRIAGIHWPFVAGATAAALGAWLLHSARHDGHP